METGSKDKTRGTHGPYTVHGQPPAKSNTYRVVSIRGRGALAKGKGLAEYERAFFMQCPMRGAGVDGLFRLDADVFFRSMLPDLDNALKVVLDCLQGCGAVRDDRRCVEIRARKLVDRDDPRVVFTVTEERREPRLVADVMDEEFPLLAARARAAGTPPEGKEREK